MNINDATLLKVPTVGEAASMRAAPVGLLKNTPVDKSFLKPGVTKTTRNNYKAVASSAAGITIDDLEKWIEELTQFLGISDGQ